MMNRSFSGDMKNNFEKSHCLLFSPVFELGTYQIQDLISCTLHFGFNYEINYQLDAFECLL